MLKFCLYLFNIIFYYFFTNKQNLLFIFLWLFYFYRLKWCNNTSLL